MGMPVETGIGTEQETTNAPMHLSERYILVPHAQGNGQIAEEIPHVAGKAVEHSADERLMVGQACHLPVGRVTEVGQHQQHHAADVPQQLGMIKTKSGARTKKHRQDGHEIRRHPNLNPHQRKSQSYRTRKINIEPFLSIIRLERLTKQLLKTFFHFQVFLSVQSYTFYMIITHILADI